MDETVLVNTLKVFYLITSPVTFLVGIFLLYDLNVYLRLERILGKTYGLSKKMWLATLEKNRENLQVFLLKRRRLVGIICLLNSMAAFFINSFLMRR